MKKANLSKTLCFELIVYYILFNSVLKMRPTAGKSSPLNHSTYSIFLIYSLGTHPYHANSLISKSIISLLSLSL